MSVAAGNSAVIVYLHFVDNLEADTVFVEDDLIVTAAPWGVFLHQDIDDTVGIGGNSRLANIILVKKRCVSGD